MKKSTIFIVVLSLAIYSAIGHLTEGDTALSEAKSLEEENNEKEYSAESYYENVINELSSDISSAEKSLSGLNFESPDAQKKIKQAWDVRWQAVLSRDEAKKSFKSAVFHLKDKDFESAHILFGDVSSKAESIKNNLKWITAAIDDAKKMENKYQSQNSENKEKTQNDDGWWTGLQTFMNDFIYGIQHMFDSGDTQKPMSKQNKNKVTVKEDLSHSDSSTKQPEKKIDQIKQSEKEKQALQEKIRMQSEQAAKEKLALEMESRRQLEQLEEEKQAIEIEARRQAEQAEQERARLQEEAWLEQQRIESEARQRENLLEIENEKQSILANYAWSPFIMGLTDDEITFYVEPLPSYASNDVRNQVENLASWMDGKIIQGVELKRVYSAHADITINWVTNYQEHAIGRQIGSHLIVGLGRDGCYGEWLPFNGYTVYKIMWHEIGHALGHDHVNDVNNIMNGKGTGSKFEYDYDSTIILSDGYTLSIPFCASGDYYFTTQTTNSNDGYKIYVVPPNSDVSGVISGKTPFYLSCSAYENKMLSFSNSCSVEYGSSLVIYNPSTFGAGRDITIDIKIYNRNPDHQPDLALPDSSMYFTQDFIDHVWTLFHTQPVMP